MTSVLSRNDIHQLLKQEPPLVEGWLDLEEQVQPNGFDITLRDVSMLQSAGRIAVSNEQRLLPALAPLAFDGLGFIDLIPGTHTLRFGIGGVDYENMDMELDVKPGITYVLAVKSEEKDLEGAATDSKLYYLKPYVKEERTE